MQQNIDNRLALQKAQQAYQQKKDEFHNNIKKTLFLQKVKKYEAEQKRSAHIAQLQNEKTQATTQGNTALANNLEIEIAKLDGSYQPVTAKKTIFNSDGSTTDINGTLNQIQNLSKQPTPITEQEQARQVLIDKGIIEDPNHANKGIIKKIADFYNRWGAE